MTWFIGYPFAEIICTAKAASAFTDILLCRLVFYEVLDFSEDYYTICKPSQI